MNEEIANFIVRFTTENLQEIKDGLKDVTKSVDSMSDSFQKSETKTGGFMDKLSGWVLSLGALAAAFYAVQKGMDAVSEAGEQVIDTYQRADSVGLAPETMERWNIAAWFQTGSESAGKSAVSQFFSGLNNLELNLREQKYSDEMLDRMSRAGFTLDYLYGAGLPENRDRTIAKLHETFQRTDLNAADFQAIKKVFNISDAIEGILKLSNEGYADLMAWAESQRVETKNPETLKAAIELRKAEIEWAQVWKEVKLELLPVVKEVKDALKPLKQPITDLAKSVGELLQAVQPLVAFVVTLTSGALKGIANFLKFIKGEMTFKDFIESIKNGLELDKGPVIGDSANRPTWQKTIDPFDASSAIQKGINYITGKILPGTSSNAPVQVDMNSKMTIDINGEPYTQDALGNIRSDKTGAIVGNIYTYATPNKG